MESNFYKGIKKTLGILGVSAALTIGGEKNASSQILNDHSKIGNIKVSETEIEDGSLEKMSLKQVMEFIGIPSDYSSRYEMILSLYDNGKKLFDESSNPYITDNEHKKDILVEDPDTHKKRSEEAYIYIGNPEQNDILKRNIIKNRHLFIKGTLSFENIKEWVLVK